MICSRCHKRDAVIGSRCEICKQKDLAYAVKRKELRKANRQSMKELNELFNIDEKKRLNHMFWSFSEYRKSYPNATFEEYSEALEQQKKRLSYEEADLEVAKLRKNRQKITDFFYWVVDNCGLDCETKNCRIYRNDILYLFIKEAIEKNYAVGHYFKKLFRERGIDTNEFLKIRTEDKFDIRHRFSCDKCQFFFNNMRNCSLHPLFDEYESGITPEDEEEYYKNRDPIDEFESRNFGQVIAEVDRNNLENTEIKSIGESPQYPKEESHSEYSGVNIWDSGNNEPEQPKKKSNQERLKEEFGERGE